MAASSKLNFSPAEPSATELCMLAQIYGPLFLYSKFKDYISPCTSGCAALDQLITTLC